MSGRTHAAIGANAVWVASLVAPVDPFFLVFMPIGGLAGLLPDIDARSAAIHDFGGFLFRWIGRLFRHRGFFHSILATCIVFVLSVMFLWQYHIALPVIITVGYFSHPFIDGFNEIGVEYFYPHGKNYNLIPKILRSPIGGVWDILFFILGVGGIGYFMYTFWPQLTNFS